MSNSLKNTWLFGRRALLAVPVSMSLIAFGCLTADAQTAPSPSQRTIRKLTADQAAMIMTNHRPSVRVLGPVNPAFSGSSGMTSSSSDGSLSNGTVTVSQEGTTIVSAPMTARNITPTSTAGRVTPVSTARSIQPVSTAVNIKPASATAVRIVNDGRGVTVTNQ